jgi:hypothetical protein
MALWIVEFPGISYKRFAVTVIVLALIDPTV